METNRIFKIDHPPRVYIYGESTPPSPTSHGAGLVICSHVQAFLDLGCEVEFVFIRTREITPSSPGYFKHLNCTVVDARGAKAPLYARLAYWAGWPRELAWWQFYRFRNILLREVKARIQRDGAAVHVFELLRTANVIPCLPKALTIWACHEIESESRASNSAINQKLEKRQPHGYEVREVRRLSALEHEVARSSGLILCVAPNNAKQIAEEWSVPHAAYLPFSIPYAETTIVSGDGRRPGELRLMHVGYLEHLPTFTSLEFILLKVFPLLDADTISRLKLEVIGEPDTAGARTKAILEMARPYPMVRFSGLIEDIRAAYRRNDLQLVGSSRATGVRTRIIESWAFGMPVLSTTVGAGGVEGLAPGRNILIADDPQDFARNLRELIHAPEQLDRIASAARETYEARYGRRAVAAALHELLNTHFDLRLPSPASAEAVAD